MNLLSGLPYAIFDDLSIEVKTIRYGWMHICVRVNDKMFNYSTSYRCDPLNDLLKVAAAIAEKKKIYSEYFEYHPQSIGNYFYIFHDCEGWSVTWLFKTIHPDELAILIWSSDPADYETLFELAEVDFDKEAFKYISLEDAPDLTNNFVFAVKGPVKKFINALVKTIDNLPHLPENEEENYDNWGYNYSIENYALLKKWLIRNNE